jgi:hypothetical protein
VPFGAAVVALSRRVSARSRAGVAAFWRSRLPLLSRQARPYIAAMCGRVIQARGPLHYAIVDGLDVRDSRLSNYPRRFNGCPSQEMLVIRQNHKTGERSLDLLKWGLIPYWCTDTKGARKPINAKSETVATLPTFRDGYRLRRCILPVDGFYEWMATKGGKQPYAIAMRDGSPLASPPSGRTGKTPPASGCARLLCSRRRPTRWWHASTTACQRSCGQRITTAGWEWNPTRVICSRRSQPSR